MMGYLVLSRNQYGELKKKALLVYSKVLGKASVV
jgi:hypothetical protein